MTNYENLQPPKRLENHELRHISSLARQPEIESGEICRHFQLWTQQESKMINGFFGFYDLFLQTVAIYVAELYE